MPIITVKLNDTNTAPIEQRKRGIIWMDPIHNVYLDSSHKESQPIDTDASGIGVNHYLDIGLKSRVIVQASGTTYNPP